MSYYLHVVPGRVRVKIPLIKGEEKKAQEVERVLKELAGVVSVSVYSLTGSVVVYFDSEIVSSEDILQALQKKGYFDESKVVTSDQYIQNVASKAGRSIGKALFGLAIEKAFEGSGLSILAALI